MSSRFRCVIPTSDNLIEISLSSTVLPLTAVSLLPRHWLYFSGVVSHSSKTSIEVLLCGGTPSFSHSMAVFFCEETEIFLSLCVEMDSEFRETEKRLFLLGQSEVRSYSVFL